VETKDAVRWFTNRPWSRAGAIAATMASAGPGHPLRLGWRVLLLVGGSLLIAVAVAAMLWNSFGPGPLDVFIFGLRETTGIPLTVAYWAAFGGMVVVALLLGRRPGPGTIVTPLILGPAVEAMLAVVDQFDRPGSLVVQVIIHVAAIGLVGVGAGALIVSGLGAGTGELLATAASDRTGRPEPHVRFGFEMGWLVVGVLLGGPIGVGTVIVAGLLGPAVANGRRLVNGLIGAPGRTLPVPVPYSTATTV
jgi:uncharacterized membrane protein YczE